MACKSISTVVGLDAAGICGVTRSVAGGRIYRNVEIALQWVRCRSRISFLAARRLNACVARFSDYRRWVGWMRAGESLVGRSNESGFAAGGGQAAALVGLSRTHAGGTDLAVERTHLQLGL